MGVIVVDRRYDIQVINTAARRLLGIHSAAVGEDLVHLARGVAAADLREALDAALRAEGPGVAKQLVTEDPARSGAALQLDAFPYGPLADGESLALLLVSDVTATVQARRQAEQLAGRVREVSETNRQLLEANRELIEANADLLTENEELLVGQEEAEAATEEVETLNEELQATNEEQETLNEELQATVEELNTTNDDLQARGQELQVTAVALEAERSQLQAILGGMGDAVLVLDASGEPVLTNASYDRLLGTPRAPLAPEDEQGQPLPPEMGFAERARRGETYSMQFTLTSEDGSRRWFEARGQPVRIETGERGSVVTVRDVTDRSLRRLQEQFVAMASHELRTPLAALTGFLQLLLRQRAGEDPEGRRKRQTELALAQARRLNVLVDDLLDVARLESGRMRLATERIDLRALVADAVEVVQAVAQDQAVRLDASAAGDGPLWVRGDPRRLQQALMNLLTNAIAYAPGTPTIDVRLRRVLSSLETPSSPDAPVEPAPATPKETATDSAPGWAEVDVQDYGPGISEADVPQLFTRFYRVAREDRASPPGLGLGLFIANEIVAAHRGRIEVHTVPGAGATFTIRLPLLPEEGAAMGAAADEGPDAPESTSEDDDGRP
jgi:two-component system CheB/CheR fusion protein